ncbi:MAG: hypothetical protein OEW45_23060 [Deltaproteobacteria bacterium]|nr:hypothetical protein [Deltaproteobacteria bacterium]
MMDTPKIIVTGLFLIFLALFSPLAYGQDSSSGESKWEFVVIPYFWLASLDGDVTVKGIKSSVSLSGSDLLDMLDYGGEVHVEAWKGRWGIFLDPTFLKLSDDGRVDRPLVGRIDVGVDLKEWLVEFGGLYTLGRWPLGTNGGKAVSFDVLGGGRYWYLKGKLNGDVPLFGLSRRVEQSKDWIDPIVGARLRADLSKKLCLAVRGDIGGFSVGSDFTWNASAIFGYQFSQTVSAWLRYRGLGVDYESGSGFSKFKYDVIMQGPIVGLGFRF